MCFVILSLSLITVINFSATQSRIPVLFMNAIFEMLLSKKCIDDVVQCVYISLIFLTICIVHDTSDLFNIAELHL